MMSADRENQTLESPSEAPDPTPTQPRQQQWETEVREWLSSLPEAVTVSNVEAWVDLNRTSLPDHITSMSPQDLYLKFTSLQSSTPAVELSTPPPKQKDANQDNLYPYRFQRTDLWMPVYTWLESLDTDELVNSQDILNWLTENPEIREQLSVKHSRYHLMHYIKKCHIKMLKRKEKKKGVKPTGSVNPVKIQKTQATSRRVPVPYDSADNASNNQPRDYLAGNASNKLPKDCDLYAAKRREALKKYEILVELEKQLSVLFPKPQIVD